MKRFQRPVAPAPHRVLRVIAAAAFLAGWARAAAAADDHAEHHHGPGGSSELGHRRTAPHAAHPHLTHPLVTESPLPENQFRLDLSYARLSDGGDGDEVAVEASVEFALTPNVGVELALPYVWINGDDGAGDSDGLGNAEVAVKFADYRFGASGVILGAGLEAELPTGDDGAGTGDDRQVGLEPYVGFGYAREQFEMIGLLRFGVPVNERAADAAEVDLELGLDVSLLYHLTPRVAGLLEFNGAAVVAGASDETILTINPGVSLDPIGDGRMRLGVGFGVPVTDDAGFDFAARTMLIVHF